MNKKGLTSEEAESLFKKHGPNEIHDVSKKSPFILLFHQVKSNFIIYLLFFGMLVSFFIGKLITAFTILAVILMVTIVGFVQEYRAEKAIASLKRMLVPMAIVIRNGREKEIRAAEIVPGDILVLRTGEKVPADCVLLEESELRVNESILTGESRDVEKKVSRKERYSDENLLFMGTYIVNGVGLAKVIHTGMNTRFGKIAGMISTAEKELPLQKKVNTIAKYMVVLAIAISVVTGAIILSRSSVITEEVVFSVLILVIALTVSAFPEGFPVVLITTLASGAYKMAKQNAIVNRMSIIETLGETTVICSDKTGTLTKGEMTVKRIFADNSFFQVTGTGYSGEGVFLQNGKKADLKKERTLFRLIETGVLCNDAIMERVGSEKEFKTIGSATESALLIMGVKAGLFKEEMDCSKIYEIPFNSSRKMMSVLCESGKEKIVYSKGALEYILSKCKYIQKGGKIARLKKEDIERIFSADLEMTTKALRTVSFAYKKVSSFNKSDFEDNLIFLGISGLEDTAREGVKEAIMQCRSAGISVKMVTGDNKETAKAIATQIGLSGRVVEGKELDKMTDEELSKIIGDISVFARVLPEHKLRLVNILKSNGEIVTMTGDGVNDAPALKEAHIGIAMGIKGTDVSRSVADLTLKDDNFATIVSAIREGRTIFKNIRKFTTYQLSCNFAELSILFIGVLLAPFLGWQIPLLLALHILFMNLVTDNLPAITLGLNPSSKDVMIETPRKNSHILNKKLILLLGSVGFLLTALILTSFFVSFNILGLSVEYARTVALLSLICLEIVSAFNFRSFRKGVFDRGIFANPFLVYASLASLAAAAIIVYTPLNHIFETVPIGLDGLLIVLLSCIVFAVVFDIFKFVNKKLGLVDFEKD